MLGSAISRAFKAFNDRWTEQRHEAENVFGDERSAHLIGVFLEELHAMRTAELAVDLTVQEAAAVSGYDPSSIWRMLKEGDLDAVGDADNTRIVATDLPLKIDTKQTQAKDSEGRVPELGGSKNHPVGAAELELIND